MKVWTVSSTDNPDGDPLDHCVTGSYTSREQALDECVKYILERIGMRADIAWCVAHDEKHDAARFFSERRSDMRTVVRRGCVGKLRAFLREELGRCPHYYVCAGNSQWDFDVDESQVEGELWHTVTWGDSDCEDPEFTTPWPEAFTSEDKAIESFYHYALDLKREYEQGVSDGFKPFVYDSLRKNGKCQVDLADGCCVSCVLYHDDAKNVKD